MGVLSQSETVDFGSVKYDGRKMRGKEALDFPFVIFHFSFVIAGIYRFLESNDMALQQPRIV